MKKEFVLSLPDGEVTAANAASLTGKLSQLAGGAVYSDSGQAVVLHDRKLDALESRNLLQRLGRCVQPFNCPHGRPTMMAISEAQLIKEFKRG